MNWERVRLGEAFEFQKKSKTKAGEGLDKGEYPFYTSSEILSKFLNEYHYEGDALVFGTGGKASVHYNGDKFSVSTDCFVIKPQNDDVFVKYVYYYLSGNIYLLEEGFKGAGLKHISKEYLSQIEIPLPPMSVQKEMVEKLDKAAAIREKSKALLAHYDALAESLFIELFGDPISNEKGWEKKNCDDLFYINLGKMLSAKNYKGDSLKPYLRNINVLWGEISLKDIKEMDFYEKEFEKYRLKKGDILVCEGGEVGKTAIFNLEEEYFIQNAIHRVRIKQPNIISQYFLYLMKYGVPNGMLEGLVNGVGIKHFTLEKFKTLEIPLPPLSLQVEFAEMVENIEEQKARAKAEIEQSEAVFQALLQESFG